MPQKHALENLRNRRIKIATINDLNDPFDLLCISLPSKQLRKWISDSRNEIARKFGMLCFCAGWNNPLLWSHYADRHRGLCFGFDIHATKLKAIRYVDHRLPPKVPPTSQDVQDLLFTKFKDWSYEREYRGWFRLDECDPNTRLYFYSFDDSLHLRQIIVGPLCDVTRGQLEDATEGMKKPIEFVKARLAFQSFTVTRQQRGLL